MSATLHTEVPADLLTQVLDAAELDDADVYRDYSGRGMYGARCFGLVVPDTSGVFYALGYAAGVADAGAHLTDRWDDAETCRDLLRVARTDSLGCDVIVYFPGYVVEAE